jgi:hypothetical protein
VLVFFRIWILLSGLVFRTWKLSVFPRSGFGVFQSVSGFQEFGFSGFGFNFSDLDGLGFFQDSDLGVEI